MRKRLGMCFVFMIATPLFFAETPASGVEIGGSDPIRGTISLVSVGPSEGGGDGPSFSGTEKGLGVSAHGRYVVFTSYATDLVANDTNGLPDVFVRDMAAGRTELASVGVGGVQGNGESRQGSISADGRFVAFTSIASNLLPGDTNDSADVFVRDLLAGRTMLVSVGLNGPADLGGHQPDISSDGGHVAFTSGATNLVPDDTNNTADIFVRDLAAGRTERVSLTSEGLQSDAFSSDSAVSASGRFVAFMSAASLAPCPSSPIITDSVVYVRDRETNTTRAVSCGGPVDPRSFIIDTAYPAISNDGRFVLFTVIGWLGVGVDPIPNVWLRDLHTDALELISADYLGRPSSAVGPVFRNDVSADGRYVAFGTPGRMTRGDYGDLSDVFRRDRETGSLLWITQRQDQTDRFGGRIGSFGPAISDDGLHVAFESDDERLVRGGGAAGFDTYLWSAVPPS